MNKFEEAQEKSTLGRSMCSRQNILWFLGFVAVMIGMVTILSISIISYLYIRTILPFSNDDVSDQNRTMDAMESESFGGSSSFPVSNHSESSDSEPSEPINVKKDTICQTEECQRTAESFLTSMNTSVDPCDDFYEFVCGNWESESRGRIQDQGQIMRERMSSRLIDLMERIDENDSFDLLQFKFLYQTCVNVGDIREEFRNATLLVEKYPEEYATLFKLFALTDPATDERRTECLALLESSHMSLSITQKYIAEYLKNGTIDKAWELQTYITSAFQNLVTSMDWMDRVTKRRVIGLAHHMEIHLGFPHDWLQKPEIITECYEELEFTNGTFAENFLAVKIWDRGWRDTRYTFNRCMKEAIWRYAAYFSPSLSDGHYISDMNAVTIGVGFLQQPVFDLGVRAADYGALGFWLGHELIHGFDDRYGLPWNTSSSSRTIYDTASECLADQYNNYLSTDQGMEFDNGLMVAALRNIKTDLIWRNAESTLEDDVADIGGLQVAFQAYILYLAQRGEPEPKLPGLENYSQEQVFFLSYAQQFCSARNHSTSTHDDEHSPPKYRVNGPVSNFREFSNSWQCPESARMNPDKKCVLWG